MGKVGTQGLHQAVTKAARTAAEGRTAVVPPTAAAEGRAAAVVPPQAAHDDGGSSGSCVPCGPGCCAESCCGASSRAGGQCGQGRGCGQSPVVAQESLGQRARRWWVVWTLLKHRRRAGARYRPCQVRRRCVWRFLERRRARRARAQCR